MDFNRFFEQCVTAALMLRLQIIHAVASDETMAARMFNQYSAKGRLRVVAQLCQAEVVDVK